MTLEVDLKKKTVFGGRSVYHWAFQNSESHEASDHAMTSLREILKRMPPSEESDEDLEFLSIAYRVGESVEIRRYKREALPLEVRRIYDLAGAYVEGRFPAEDAKPSAGSPVSR